MKKYLMIALAALSFTLVSCQKSVEDQAIEYAEEMKTAVKEMDFKKAAEINKEYQKWFESLSQEDKEIATKAMINISGADIDGLQDKIDEAVEDIQDQTEDVQDQVDEEIEKAKEQLDEVMEKTNEEIQNAIKQ